MSTRGAIARPTTTGWSGRYHHFDSYPRGLGAELFHLYHRTFDRDHHDMARVLIDDHPTGWSTIMSSSDEGPYPRTHFDQSGFTEIDSPARGHYPECYCHGTRDDPEDLLLCRCPADTTGCNPVWIEWAYVITPTGMNILSSRHPDPRQDLTVHRAIAHVPWIAPNPNWDAIEHLARHDRSHTRHN